MRLHTKLILALLAGLVVVVAGAQLYSYLSVNDLILKSSQKSLNLLQTREEEFAKNIYHSVEQAVAGSLERGEMEKFNKLLRVQRDVEGLLEFSLFDENGVVTHSSDDAFLNTKLPEAIQKDLYGNPRTLLLHGDEAIEIYQPQIITGDCVRCHIDWKVGGIGGVTHFRFSTAALTKAQGQTEQIKTELKNAAMKNSLYTMFGIITTLIIMMYFLMRKYIRRPLEQFVNLLELYDKDEGDLTRRIPVKSSDELGDLARLFNSFIGKLNKAIAHAQTTAHIVGDGAKEQAGSVEETTASMEELTSITKQNADIARETDQLMSAVTTEMRQAHAMMSSLTQAMDELIEKSGETVKIVRTIDDIAFQTNLLALNAAVEAARAGEVGAGFAVVASEVRNLATKTAEAAHNTAELIQGTVDKINEGNEVVLKTASNFSSLEEQSNRARSLMEKIKSSSEDQDAKFQHVSKALSEINMTTQKSAAQSTDLTMVLSVFTTAVDQDEEN